MNKLSLCITTFNRTDLTVESFSKVYDHPMIDEIIIVDDASDVNKFNELYNLLKGKDKVTLHRNFENLGMSRNKANAIEKANNEWVSIFDSDNVMPPEYLDSLPKDLNPTTIYHPEFAEPEFDFRAYPVINKFNAKDYLGERNFRCFLNNSNYVVNREMYLQCYRYDEGIRESDTIHFAYLWLEMGGSFQFVKGMRYFHRRHPGSGWLCGDHAYNIRKANEIQDKIKNL